MRFAPRMPAARPQRDQATHRKAAAGILTPCRAPRTTAPVVSANRDRDRRGGPDRGGRDRDGRDRRGDRARARVPRTGRRGGVQPSIPRPKSTRSGRPTPTFGALPLPFEWPCDRHLQAARLEGSRPLKPGQEKTRRAGVRTGRIHPCRSTARVRAPFLAASLRRVAPFVRAAFLAAAERSGDLRRDADFRVCRESALRDAVSCRSRPNARREAALRLDDDRRFSGAPRPRS